MKIEVRRGSGRILGLKRVLGGVWAAHKSEIVANMAPSWLQNGAKIDKKSMQKSIKKYIPFKIWILMDFGRENGAKLVPKSF